MSQPLINRTVELASERKAHVLAILPRGEAIRNFVYTDALRDITRDAEVSLLSVFPSDDLEHLLKSQFDHVYELSQTRERWAVRFSRELLDMTHGRWLWSKAAQDRWRLRDLEADSSFSRLKRGTKKVLCYPLANRVGLAALSKVERTASRWFRTSDEYLTLFKKIRPSLVFNGSHVHSRIATPAVEAAQFLGIPTATFIFSWDNLTSQGRIMEPYDYFLVWNEAIRDQLLTIYKGLRPEQVFITGTPQFDFHFSPQFYWTREEFCRRVGADPARPIVLYSTGMPNHMPGEPRIVEQIADLLGEMPDLGPAQLLVRVYPKDRTGRFEELKGRRSDILFPDTPWEPIWLTPKLDDSYLLTNTLRHVAAGINVASTISLELCMFDKPVINVGYNPSGEEMGFIDYRRYYEFDHYKPLVERRAVSVAQSERELSVMLRQALTDPQSNSYQRRSFISSMFGSTLDGRAGNRVAEVLLELGCRQLS